MNHSSKVKGKVVEGHRVASGSNGNPLFPGGTLRMQLPFFQKQGLDLSGFHLATINLSIAPLSYKIMEPNWHFKNLAWHPTEAAEDFSFVEIQVGQSSGATASKGLIYYPHPETKPAHHQPEGLMELVLESFIEGIKYGDELWLTYPDSRVKLI